MKISQKQTLTEGGIFAPNITKREKQVLTLVGEGLTGKEIAKTLGITKPTVEAHRAHLKEKLGPWGVKNTKDLVRYAVLNGFTDKQ